MCIAVSCVSFFAIKYYKLAFIDINLPAYNKAIIISQKAYMKI